MAVVLISGECFAGRSRVAERVAGILGCGVADDNVIIEKAAAFGLSHAELRKALDEPAGWPQARRSACFEALRAALLEEISRGDAVYWGEAPLLLNEPGPFLRVRVEAPEESRTALVAKRLKLGREEALAFLRARDNQRERWVRDLHGVCWRDASLYDLLINAGHLGWEGAAVSVAAATATVVARPGALAELVAASRVRAVQELESVRSRSSFFGGGMGRIAAVARAARYGGLMTLLLGGVILYSSLMGRVASRILDPLLLPGNLTALSVSGVVTDTACGAGLRRMQPPDSECVKSCVRNGGGDVHYALWDGRRLYILDGDGRVEGFAGEQVAVEGVLDREANRLTVDCIGPL